MTLLDHAHAEASSPPEELVVARQPIFDRELAVCGFELLYRPIAGHGRPIDPERATATVLSAALGEIGLRSLVGTHPAFVNVTRRFLLDVRPLPVASDRVILELLEDEVVDAALLEVLGELVSSGFTLALDDFTYRPELEPLLDLATYVKLDIRALSTPALAAHVSRLRERDLTLIAEKVETREELDHCRQLGFDGFQGYFFARPEVVRQRRTPTFRLGALRALIATDDDAFEQLERLITHDVGLSHKLLRLVNSAHVAPPSRVSSVRHALALLGARTVRRWVIMLLLADGHGHAEELLLTGLIRARLCELVARRFPGADADRAFTAGLFSVADALLGAPLRDVVGSLPFDERLTHALLDHRGPEGRILAAALAYERGYFESAADSDADLGALARNYYGALEWAYDFVVSLR